LPIIYRRPYFERIIGERFTCVKYKEEEGGGAEFIDFFFRPGILFLSAYANGATGLLVGFHLNIR